MPLALELAAVRVTAQSPAQIAEELAASLIDLKSRQRGLSERHRSLRAALQGSYDLLDPDLQAFFRKLSVFEGGWTARAAAYATGSADAQGQLEELVIRSLARLEKGRSERQPRYGFLDTMRQFAIENLSESEALEAEARHAEFFRREAAQADENDLRTFAALDDDQENLIRGFRGERDALFWEALAGALEHAFVRGRHRLALRWIDEFASEFASIPDLFTRIRVRNAACQILPDVGRLEQARELAEAMRADADAHGDERGAIYADVVLGYVAEFTDDLDEAEKRHREALRKARELGSTPVLETSLAHASGTIHDVGCRQPEGSALRQVFLEESEILARELKEIVRPFSRRKPLARLLTATSLKYQGKIEEAQAWYRDAEKSATELGTTTEMMFAFVYESEIFLEQGHPERAALAFGGFLALQERMGYSLDRAQYIRPAWITRIDETLREGHAEAVALGRSLEPADLIDRLQNH
jgi:hypothetical protein